MDDCSQPGEKSIQTGGRSHLRLNVYIGFAQPDEWANWAGTYARHVRRFEDASEGTPCLVLPFGQATPEMMARLAPDAVVMSGFARSFQDYDPASFHPVCEWVSAAEVPILALCGSHQLLGYLFNGDLQRCERLYDEPMRPLRPDEPVTNPDYHPDHFMERGFYLLELTGEGRSDPLFAGLGETPYLYESHYCEIKRLPPDFTLLASTPECRVQAMRHRSRPLYGVQFHPEDFSDRFPGGRLLLENFFRLASFSKC
jgi:GMP synthase (glutamine-hydrolysing)